MTEHTTQLAVIGAGPGGYAAAFMAADLGLKVTLIDPEDNPGGACLYRGCIPSKALLHVARLINETDDAAEWGVRFSRPEIRIDSLRSWKNGVVAKLTGGLGGLVAQRHITYVQGTAVFSSNRTLEIRQTDGGHGRLTFDHAIIATGALPSRISRIDIDTSRVMDSTAALDLADIPKKLLVIGGGYIGLELGTAYAGLGSRVTVVEMLPQLLQGVDADLVAVLEKRLVEDLEAVLKETTIDGMKAQKNGIRVTLQPTGGNRQVKIFDKVLMAVGRRPVTDTLGLEKTGIELDDRGFIRVDDERRTTEAHIFAIGDVAGEPMLAHKASHEGRIAAEVIAGRKVIYAPLAVPAVVFTDPEIAWAGLTETEARDRGIDCEVTRFPWAASGRAGTLGRRDGVTKLLIAAETERILGVGIVGPGAGELIAEGVLAIEMEARATDLSLAIHPQTTHTETHKQTADLFHGTATHFNRPRRR